MFGFMKYHYLLWVTTLSQNGCVQILVKKSNYKKKSNLNESYQIVLKSLNRPRKGAC